MKKLILLFSCSLLALSVGAAVNETETAGEDIRIYSDKKNTIKEYRANGRVYMIQITPKKGKPYFLVDADGDGDFDTRHNDLTPNLKIPSWVIFSW